LKISFDQFLNRFELLVLRIPHQFEQRHLDIAGHGAGEAHLFDADPAALLGAAGDAVTPAGAPGVPARSGPGGLVDANVGLQAAEEDLGCVGFFELLEERGGARNN
jgi:hypothetical protein